MRSTFAASARPAQSVSSLEEVESAFLALAGPPWPLTLPGSLLTDSDAGMLPVSVVRARLVHPNCNATARVRVWGEVLRRRQEQGEPWATVAVGFTVPGLRRVLKRLPRLTEVEACELEQEVLVAVCAELATLPAQEPQAGLRLLRAGDRAAHRLLYAAKRARRVVVPLDDTTVPQSLPVGDDAGVFAVLDRAVEAGVLGEREAELIALTRLERQAMAKAAAAVGMSVRAAFRRRSAAEQRLADALVERER